MTSLIKVPHVLLQVSNTLLCKVCEAHLQDGTEVVQEKNACRTSRPKKQHQIQSQTAVLKALMDSTVYPIRMVMHASWLGQNGSMAQN